MHFCFIMIQAKKDEYKKHSALTGGVTKFAQQQRALFTMDAEGLFSITHANEAEVMCKLIAAWFPHASLCTITDACAGVGGNAIAFVCSQLFKHVNVVECNSSRVNDHLAPNLSVASLLRSSSPTSYYIHTANYLDIHATLEQDVVFLDPPWGGVDYKTNPNVELSLTSPTRPQLVSINSLLEELFQTHKRLQFVVLKAPFNFDIHKQCSSQLYITILHTFQKYLLYIIKRKV